MATLRQYGSGGGAVATLFTQLARDAGAAYHSGLQILALSPRVITPRH